MKQLVIFPTGSLTQKDKERMSKEGYLAIESPDPSKVVMPMPSGDLITGNMLLSAALVGIRKGGYDSVRCHAWEALSALTEAKMEAATP